MTLETGDKEEPKQRWKRWKKNRWQKEESPSCGYLYFVSALLFSTWRKKHCFFPFCLFLVMKGSKNLRREKDRRSRLVSKSFFIQWERCVCVCVSLSSFCLFTPTERCFFLLLSSPEVSPPSTMMMMVTILVYGQKGCLYRDIPLEWGTSLS